MFLEKIHVFSGAICMNWTECIIEAKGSSFLAIANFYSKKSFIKNWDIYCSCKTINVFVI